MSGTSHCNILIADDDDNDVFFLQRALEKAGLDHPVHVVADGAQAIHYLSGEAPFTDRTACPLPHIIFLDLKMPFVSGFGVLEWLATRPDLSHLRVFILTGSLLKEDRTRALELGAADFLIKPATPEMLRKLLT